MKGRCPRPLDEGDIPDAFQRTSTLPFDSDWIFRALPKAKLKKTGAGNETRTRDPDLGKVVLYQLSYSRIGVP